MPRLLLGNNIGFDADYLHSNIFYVFVSIDGDFAIY